MPIAWLLIGLFLPAAVAGDKATYQGDVQFLLRELKQQCGALFQRKGVDWARVEQRFLKEVRGVKTDVDHYRLCERLVACLKDGHAGISKINFEWPKSEQPPQIKGIGMSLCLVDQRVYVKDCYGPALAAGISSGWEVKQIEGKPAYRWLEARAAELTETSGKSTHQAELYAACHYGLADKVGTSWSFEFKKGKRGTAKKTLSCANGGGNGVPFGPIAPPEDCRMIGRHSYGRLEGGFGYIHLRKVDPDLLSSLDQMLSELGALPGLVLDFRANTGGAVDHEGFVSRFLGPGQVFGPFQGGEDGQHFTGPLVLIVDAGTASAAETCSGYLKESGRGYMIGPTPTAGMSGDKVTLDLPSGLMSVKVTVRSYRAAKGGGPEIEGFGVSPHETVPFDPQLLSKGVDPFIRRAEDLLQDGLPGSQIRYRAP